MSKLFNKYLELKKNYPETFFLFNTGLFCIFIDKDAQYLSDMLGLRLVYLNSNVYKCGFPSSQFLKYNKLLNDNNINFKIIENDYNTISDKEKYINDISQLKLIDQISNVDTDNISPHQALNILINLQESIGNLNSANSIRK